MSMNVLRTMDFNNVARVINLPNAVADQEPVTMAQLKAALEGLNDKPDARVATVGNINLAAPGAAIDGITMAVGDRVVVWKQTTGAENGIYVWNGAAVPLTRAADGSTWKELENALIPVCEGTNAQVVLRQTAINGTLGTTTVNFIPFGTAAVQATEAISGISKIATQAMVDAGIDDQAAVTALKLANSVFARRKATAVIGDGSTTAFIITHNFGTRDVAISVFRNSGNYEDVLVETYRSSVNAIAVVFEAAPAANAFQVSVRT